MSSTLNVGGNHATSQPSDLGAQRMHAAELSGGISSDAIYVAIEQMIGDKDLRGAVLDYGAGVGHLTRRLLELHRFESVTGADLMGCADDLVGRVRWIQHD